MIAVWSCRVSPLKILKSMAMVIMRAGATRPALKLVVHIRVNLLSAERILQGGARTLLSTRTRRVRSKVHILRSDKEFLVDRAEAKRRHRSVVSCMEMPCGPVVEDLPTQ